MGATMLSNSAWPPEMNMLDPIINVLVFFENAAPPLPVIIDNFQKHLWPCYRFNNCAEDGHFVSKSATMDAAYHFSDMVVADEKAVDSFAQGHMSDTLDASWPLWKVFVLRAVRGRSAMFVRIHHVLGDGLGLLFAISPMLDCGAGVDPLKTIALPAVLLPKSSRPEASTRAPATARQGCCASACMLARGFTGPLVVKPDSELRINAPLADRTPFLKFNGNRVYTRFPAVPLSAVKAVKEKHACTVNEVLLAALAGALRRYGAAVHNDERLDDHTPCRLEFKCMMMMGLPRKIDDDDLTSALVNNILFSSCPLPIDEPSPLGRLERIVATCATLKNTTYVGGLVGVTRLASSSFPRTLHAKLASELFSKHSLLVSCTPGMGKPTVFPKHASGQTISEIQMVFPNCIPQISIITYNGAVYANIVADPALYPEPYMLGEFWVSEFRDLALA